MIFFLCLFLCLAPAYAGDFAEVNVSSAGKPYLRASMGRVTGSGEIIGAPTADSQPRQDRYSPYTYPPYKSAAGLIILREVCAEAGCSAALLVEDWAERGYNRQEYRFDPGTLVRTKLFCANGKWTAKSAYKLNTIRQGHNHSDIPPPPLLIGISTDAVAPAVWRQASNPIPFPEMSGNTTYYFWVQLPVFSAAIEEAFSASGACSAERADNLRAEIWGLIELPPLDHLFFGEHQNSESAHGHPVNLYGTQVLVSAVISIAEEYGAAFPGADLLRIYDMSLPYGGIVDINNDWKRPFYGHASGIDADISKWRVPAGNRRKLLEIMCKHADTYLEQDVHGKPPYFHIRVPDKYANSPLESFASNPQPMIKCCSRGKVDPAVVEVCIREDSGR